MRSLRTERGQREGVRSCLPMLCPSGVRPALWALLTPPSARNCPSRSWPDGSTAWQVAVLRPGSWYKAAGGVGGAAAGAPLSTGRRGASCWSWQVWPSLPSTAISASRGTGAQLPAQDGPGPGPGQLCLLCNAQPHHSDSSTQLAAREDKNSCQPSPHCPWLSHIGAQHCVSGSEGGCV